MTDPTSDAPDPAPEADAAACGTCCLNWPWLKILFGVCGVLLITDIVLTVKHVKHGHFDWENMPVFYGGMAVVACVTFVCLGIGLRHLVARDGGYYDE